jgi:hypothetical protein
VRSSRISASSGTRLREGRPHRRVWSARPSARRVAAHRRARRPPSRTPGAASPATRPAGTLPPGTVDPAALGGGGGRRAPGRCRDWPTDPWTPAHKRAVMDRPGSGHHHDRRAVAEQGVPTLVSMSGVGYYGNPGDTVLDEDSPPRVVLRRGHRSGLGGLGPSPPLPAARGSCLPAPRWCSPPRAAPTGRCCLCSGSGWAASSVPGGSGGPGSPWTTTSGRSGSCWTATTWRAR